MLNAASKRLLCIKYPTLSHKSDLQNLPPRAPIDYTRVSIPWNFNNNLNLPLCIELLVNCCRDDADSGISIKDNLQRFPRSDEVCNDDFLLGHALFENEINGCANRAASCKYGFKYQDD